MFRSAIRAYCGTGRLVYRTLFLWDGTTFIGSLVPNFVSAASAESAEALLVHLGDDGYR